jgi:AraC family transcriptional regulator
MLIRSLPAIPANDAGFHRWFDSKWGRESCILWGRTREADFGPVMHTLSIRAAWSGAEQCQIDGRTVAVDDDNFLIINHGQVYSTRIRAERPVESLSICFRPQLVEQICAQAAMSVEQSLSGEGSAAAGMPEFLENLQPHDRLISPVLRFIRAHLVMGLVDEAWYEEQLIFLLQRMLRHHGELVERIERLALVRASTRREVYRRIALATDFLQTNYASSVPLSTLAKIACLSKYHFLRLFALVHGVTPRAYLERKRVTVAIRLLESSPLSIPEVAASVGFSDRCTLMRLLRRSVQLSIRNIRPRNRKVGSHAPRAVLLA